MPPPFAIEGERPIVGAPNQKGGCIESTQQPRVNYERDINCKADENQDWRNPRHTSRRAKSTIKLAAVAKPAFLGLALDDGIGDF